MSFIDHISFNAELYTHAPIWTLLLYQRDGVHPAISLPNADLMSFIQVFNDRKLCHNHINANDRKMITLFGYKENIEQWLAENSSLSKNLVKIKIFCESGNRFFLVAWIRCYMQKLRTIIFDVISIDKLNYELLLFGVDLLQTPRPSSLSSEDSRRLDNDYRRICHALANYFWHEANNQNM
jgi:hypothetical protein